jgi:hypothetical protein
MLSFAEEIYLLALDETTGKPILNSRNIEMQSALVGAILGELSFTQRIDTDMENIYVLDKKPVGNPLLDDTLAVLAKEDEPQSLTFWIKELLSDARAIEAHVLQELIRKNILTEVETKILWVFPTRQYPVIDGRQLLNIETRLRNLVLSDEIPDPRETVLVSLVDACGLFPEILSPRELARSGERIALLARMDSIGRAVSDLIRAVNKAYITLHMG